jgi:hypothetical protein
VDFGSIGQPYRVESRGGSDAFVYVVQPDGTVGAPLHIGGPGSEGAWGLTLDTEGNLFIVGHAGPDTDFDPGPGKDYQRIKDSRDAFLTKINSNGSYGWTRTFGGPGFDLAYSVAVSHDGHLAIAGYYDGPFIDLDPGDEVDLHWSRGGPDAFVSRFSSDGAHEWGFVLGADYWDMAEALGMDSHGAVYFGGYVHAARSSFGVDMDPTEGLDLRFPRGGDCFVTKVSASGDYVWSIVLGGANFDKVNSLLLDANDQLSYAGRLEHGADVDLDPTEGEDIHRTVGQNEVFVTLLLPPE